MRFKCYNYCPVSLLYFTAAVVLLLDFTAAAVQLLHFTAALPLLNFTATAVPPAGPAALLLCHSALLHKVTLKSNPVYMCTSSFFCRTHTVGHYDDAACSVYFPSYRYIDTCSFIYMLHNSQPFYNKRAVEFRMIQDTFQVIQYNIGLTVALAMNSVRKGLLVSKKNYGCLRHRCMVQLHFQSPGHGYSRKAN